MIGRLVIAVALLLPWPVLARSDTGTRLGGRPAQVPTEGTMPDRERARIWLERYAACLTKRDPMRVGKVLNAALDAPTTMKDLSQGNSDSCLSAGGDADQLRMSYVLLRGALYADRVSRTVTRLTPEMIADRPLAVPSTNVDPARLATVLFGDCIMRQDPSAALAYVAAHATTGVEDKAIAALRPSLSACVFSDQKLKLSRDGIKAAVAEAIYRTTRAPVAVKAGAN